MKIYSTRPEREKLDLENKQISGKFGPGLEELLVLLPILKLKPNTFTQPINSLNQYFYSTNTFIKSLNP